MTIRRMAFTIAAFALTMLTLTAAQQRPAPVKSVRLYVFENGSIRGLDPKLFNFTREELKQVDFTNTSYLIVHPKGTLMFDCGAVEDSHFKGDGAPVSEGIMTATKPLLPQLASAGYKPSDITYFAMSHYHSDHTANANAFAKATWIVQKAERDFMFSDKPQGIIQPAQYSALKDAKKHQQRQVRRESAEQRRQRESGHRGHQQPLSAEVSRVPSLAKEVLNRSRTAGPASRPITTANSPS